MSWSRKHTLIAGLALMALTNAVALVGVAWNRSAEEAKLRLSERELHAPYRWYGNRENSGLALNIAWRVLSEPADATALYGWSYGVTGGAPSWLDEAKMRELGFDTSTAGDAQRGRVRYEKQLPREVLLVLELEGQTYRRLLELAAQYVAREEAKLASSPADKNYEARVKNAREALERETSRNSRLFVVDAGLDAAALRAKYPDRARYAIVRGQVRPAITDAKSARLGGYVTDLAVESINVPLAFREALAGAAASSPYDERSRSRFEATVAFGRRLEPWIAEASRK